MEHAQFVWWLTSQTHLKPPTGHITAFIGDTPRVTAYSTHHKRIQLVHLQVFVERQPSIGKWIEPLINETFELPFSLVKSCKIRSFVGNHIGKWYKLVVFPNFSRNFLG